MLKNGQTYFKILRCSHRKIFKICLATARFSKYVWPFFNIMKERVSSCCRISESIEMSGNMGTKLVKRAFKSYSYFVTIKKTIKKQAGSAWNFLQLPLFLLPPQCLKPKVRINKMVNEHNVNYHHKDACSYI